MGDAKTKRPPSALGLVLPIAFLAVSASMTSTGKAAAAPSAELVKKCCNMMIKAYPPVRPGSPPGVVQKEREYFQEPSTVGRDAKTPSGHKGK
jgi:hypothetical protein